MSKSLQKFFIKSFIILLIIHFAYFLYGYFKFEGVKNINIYTEFYRFKFYDDVSISHFFVTGFFLFFFLIFLVRNHSKQQRTFTDLLKTGSLLLLISFLSFSFFISYSFGLNAKLKTELSEANFNKDKVLLNTLNSFLYNYTSYSSEKLFNVLNILYPEPYPIIEEKDSTKISDDNYITENRYYSIDTLKVITTDYNKAANVTNTFFDSLGIDSDVLKKRVLKKTTIKDSTEIIYKGSEVNPRYDGDICIFLENNSLFKNVEGIPTDEQQRQVAVIRYNLIYRYGKDSLLYNFQKLDTLFKKYKIETQIVPGQLTTDVLYYKEHSNEYLNAIRNNFDRKGLTEKFTTLDKLFYQPNYLHPSIIKIYLGVIFAVWFVLLTIYFLFSRKKLRTDGSN
ncbi:hypothetical protein AMR72_17325 [Flavobacterium psychrophilum]|nr:hypothetical protein AMR72_17325 [Flavobacterium psychrophilum]AOE54111.1 hypothetical protein ALW18_17315 [Flavobacterium psychrophilum]